MKRTELDALIQATYDNAKSLERMRDSLPVEPEAVKEWPNHGDEFFYLNTWIIVQATQFDGMSKSHRAMLASGNVFRSEAPARRRVEALKVAAELRRMPGRVKYKEFEWFIAIDSDGTFETRYNARGILSAIAGVWFATEEAAQHAIDTIGQERLAVYLADFLDDPTGDE